jgi:hypothetical protein
MDTDFEKWLNENRQFIKRHGIEMEIIKNGHKDFYTRKKLRIQKNESNSHQKHT